MIQKNIRPDDLRARRSGFVDARRSRLPATWHVVTWIAAAALWLLSSELVHAQYDSKVFDLKKAADLYDERGFERGQSVSVDGRLVVTNSCGNVQYRYVLSKYQVEGHPVEVTMNYCGSVAFTAFKEYIQGSRHAGDYKGWSRFHQNRPAWIMGVNGFAINVIATSLHFKADPDSRMFKESNTAFGDGDMPFVVDGYDFCNRMTDFGAPTAHSPGELFVDQINLLRSDGSVLNLVNVRPDSSLNPDKRDDLYTGYYVANEANSHGYAVVSYDPMYLPLSVQDFYQETHYYDSCWVDTVGTPDTLRCGRFPRFSSDINPMRPRIVKYYPGTGEEFTFREYTIPYGMRAYRDFDRRSGGAYGGPTIFYLESIRGNSGPIVSFNRWRHQYFLWRGFDGMTESGDEWFWEDSTRSRALITEFDNHRITFGYNSLIVEAMGRTTTFRFDQIARNGNTALNEMMPFANIGHRTPLSLEMATWPETQSALYKSFVGYVTEIVDPEGRKTTFEYEPYVRTYRNYGFPFTSPYAGDIDVSLRNFRLKEIVEPTAIYRIRYKGQDSAILTPNGSNQQILTSNVADSVIKMTRSRSPLTREKYNYRWNGSGAIEYAEKITADAITGKERKNGYHYTYWVLSSLTPSRGDLSYVAPRHTELVLATDSTEMPRISQFTAFNQIHLLPNGTVDTTRLYVPRVATTTVGSTMKSCQTFSYVADTLRRFGSDRKLSGIAGMEILKKVVRTHDPADTTKLLRIDTVDYLHINGRDTSITWAERRWNKFASIAKFLYYRDTIADPQYSKYSWEELMFYPPVAQYTLDTLTDDVFMPPVYGLERRVMTADGSGNILAGKVNVYRTEITEGLGRQYLGSLIRDSVIGRGGTGRLLIGEYRYSDGLGSTLLPNLLSRTTNANGARVGLMYAPTFCYPKPGFYWDTCFLPPTVYRIESDSTVVSRELAPSSTTFMYGKPALESRIVRVVDSAVRVVERTLHTGYERGFYGQPTATMDPNGWISEYQYDRNGRLRFVWLPRDFARTTSTDTINYAAELDEQLFGYSTYTRRVDLLKCWVDGMGDLHDTIIQGSVVTSANGDLMIAGKSVTTTPKCYCDTTGGVRTKKGGDGGSSLRTCNDSIYFDNNAGFDNYVGHLDYHVDSLTGIGKAIRLDSAILQTYITQVQGQCVHLEVSIPQFGFSKTFLLACGGGPGVGLKARKDGSALLDGSSVTADAHGYRLRVDLDTIIPQLIAMSNGTTLRINFKVTNTGTASVTFANGWNAEDVRPTLMLRGRFQVVDKRADYTLAYTHTDAGRVVHASAKVDDIRHTASRYDQATFGGRALRRTSAVHYFGPDYRLLVTEQNHVAHDASQRIDSILNSYSGAGLKLRTIDQEGDSAGTVYDGLDRPTRLYNADGTYRSIAYYVGSPSTFGITGQDFHGFCAAVSMADENGTISTKYTDAFDRLRREVVDSGTSGTHLNLTTSYDYDILGRLTQVVGPKGDTTKYWYDDFGRVRYKHHPDLGTISYAYDSVGNVRFTQSEHQARTSLLAFNQYDDLNRLVVAGEAIIGAEDLPDTAAPGGASPNLNRLTDRFDATVLHDGGESPILTANLTLWETPTASTPLVWAPAQLDSVNCALTADTILGETSPPVGWFLRHPAMGYNPVGTPSAPQASFEDVSKNPHFVRIAVSYDTLPMVQGAVWSGFPPHAQWNLLAPRGIVRNLLGREAAVAYREHGGEPFHYAVMSYDERGRVEALIRYTENLGFDAVYYTYNSMNQVTSVRVADPLRQYTTWYGVDENGRVDSVWSLLSPLWSGLGVQAPRYVGPPARPTAADVVYRYTRGGRVDTMRYDPVSVLVTYAYNRRKWIDSLVATIGGSPLFRQSLAYDPSGQIVSQGWQHGIFGPAVTHGYAYDSAGRLTGWYDGTDTTKYLYDGVGNRMSRFRTGSLDLTTNTYAHPNGPDRLTQSQRIAGATITTTDYNYDFDGAVTGLTRTSNGGPPRWDSLKYSWRDLTMRYERGGVGQSYQDWRYRYSAGGEREQKRLYLELDSNHIPTGKNAWVYYLLGGQKEQLAVYHGQERNWTSCGMPGPAVVMYPAEYNTFGVMYPGIIEDLAQLTTRPSSVIPTGIKEFKVMDHLGSTRVTLDNVGGSATYDYNPWGKLLTSSTGTTKRQGYNGREEDRESNRFNLGVRQYDAEDDDPRFTRIDPLWMKFPWMSPYVYANNDPLRYTDPSGMQGQRSMPRAPLTEMPLPGVLGPMSGSVGGGGGGFIKWVTKILTAAFAADAATDAVLSHAKSESGSEQASEHESGQTANPGVPQKAKDVLKHVKEKNGTPPPNHKGGSKWENSKDQLPKDGSYKEYDVDPKVKGVPRGPERIVVDEKSGKSWYSPDHYDTFIPMP